MRLKAKFVKGSGAKKGGERELVVAGSHVHHTWGEETVHSHVSEYEQHLSFLGLAFQPLHFFFSGALVR